MLPAAIPAGPACTSNRKIELFANAACRHARRPRLDEKPKDRKARALGQRAERLDSLRHFHVSRIMEMNTACQATGGQPVNPRESLTELRL